MCNNLRRNPYLANFWADRIIPARLKPRHSDGYLSVVFSQKTLYYDFMALHIYVITT